MSHAGTAVVRSSAADGLKESVFGFRNILPKNRVERRGFKDKVALEKMRLAQRVGHAARMNNANAPETTSMLTSCRPGDAGYVSNSERFHTDTSGEEYQLRQSNIQRAKQIEEVKRSVQVKRDDERWQSVNAKIDKDDEKWDSVRLEGQKAKKNQSNVAYNVVTMQYEQSIHGEQQKYLDDMVRFRAQERTVKLVEQVRIQYTVYNGY